jgi:hypothetical protein
LFKCEIIQISEEKGTKKDKTERKPQNQKKKLERVKKTEKQNPANQISITLTGRGPKVSPARRLDIMRPATGEI